MEIVRIISEKLFKVYFVIITLAYVILSINLPNNIYAFMTIFYIFLGPILFFWLHWGMGLNFSSYVERNYPELMKKHSIEWGVMKGEMLNSLSVYPSKKDFESLNDPILMDYFNKGQLLINLTIISFILTPTIIIIAMLLKT